MKNTSSNQGLGLWATFYFATLLFGCAEGFFLILSLYINHVGGNEQLTGNIFVFQAIGAVTLIPLGGVILRYIRVMYLILCGIAMFALGAAMFWLSDLNPPVYYIGGLLVGAGWGITYTVTPVTVASISEPKNNVVHFGILAACNMLGMGISPVIARMLQQHHQLHAMFLLSFILALVSGILFLLLSRLSRAHEAAAQETLATQPATQSLAQAIREELGSLRQVLSSPSRYPVMMVLLGACIFSTMANFQTTFAEKNGLDYSLYYIFYTAAVIFSRIFLSSYLARFNLYQAGNAMLSLMCLALGIFLFVRGNNVLYAIAAVVLGVGYGLAYPIIKTQSIEQLPAARKASTLVCFSLSYFIGLYVFPYVAGHLIVGYGYRALLLVMIGLGLLELMLGVYSQLRQGRAQVLLANGK